MKTIDYIVFIVVLLSIIISATIVDCRLRKLETKLSEHIVSTTVTADTISVASFSDTSYYRGNTAKGNVDKVKKSKPKRMQPKKGRSYITEYSRSIDFLSTDDSVDVRQADGSFKAIYKDDVTDVYYNTQVALVTGMKSRYALDGYVDEPIKGIWQAHILINGKQHTYQGENKENCEKWLESKRKKDNKQEITDSVYWIHGQPADTMYLDSLMAAQELEKAKEDSFGLYLATDGNGTVKLKREEVK